jgi:glycoside hydrolase-like protein
MIAARMPERCAVVLCILMVVSTALSQQQPRQAHKPLRAYLGFDRNVYPGDETWAELRKTFSFTGYWLNSPPGESSNSWQGKRQLIGSHGFGFLVLFNGKRYAELKAPADPVALGRADAQAAAQAAKSEGFPATTIIFLDVEEGGRLLPKQQAYLHAWIDELALHHYLAGVYCSGIPVREAGGTTVTSAENIRQNAEGRSIVFWISNDVCPPAPGCSFPKDSPPPSLSGISFADVWQFAQSPRRKEFTAACAATYNTDGNCYPPSPALKKVFVDVNTANSPDPSHGRTRSPGAH